MQQFFIDTKIDIGDKYIFTSKQLHHAKDVVRLDNEVIRLVYNDKAFFAKVVKEEKDYYALVIEKDERFNELPYEVTLCLALIRKEKFELVLQKATELGVSRIIPFTSSRCIVKDKKDKRDRYEDILLTASEQCKRNKVPEITSTKSFKELIDYKSKYSLVAYEKDDDKYIKEVIKAKDNVTLVIGPEGGFSEEEVDYLISNGFEVVTLGNRILRAETAAMYGCSVLGEILGK